MRQTLMSSSQMKMEEIDSMIMEKQKKKRKLEEMHYCQQLKHYSKLSERGVVIIRITKRIQLLITINVQIT